MNVVLPPLLFYALGTFLILAGAMRAFFLGRARPGRDVVAADLGERADPEVSEKDEARAAADTRARRRHLGFGLVWVAMGLFLILSTARVLQRRSDRAPEVIPPASGSSAPPTVHLDPRLTVPSGAPATVSPPAAPPAPR